MLTRTRNFGGIWKLVRELIKGETNMKVKNLTECEKFKQECIKQLEIKQAIKNASQSIADKIKRDTLTKLAEEKFQNEFPLAEFKNGKVYLCGEEFSIVKPKKEDEEMFFTIYSDSGWATWPIRNKLDYAEYLKEKEIRSKDGWNLFVAALESLGIAVICLITAILIGYIWIYIFNWSWPL